ncbi:MAG: V-type ATPase subunit [Candidatus Pacearchaeota archaeon]|nr:V-type ATPase subunit [Candidatus Pacearchaeota archaeon]
MVADVSKYALINAKLRARISTILPHEFFFSLLKLRSISEMIPQLRGTAFSDCADIYDKTGDIKMVEQTLYKREAYLFHELNQFLPQGLLPLSRAYSTGYEIENLKNALRLFFDHTIRKRPIDEAIHYLMRDQLVHSIPFDPIINSTSFDDIISRLQHTPYGEIIQRKRAVVEQTQSLFPLTTDLDRFYYRQLLDTISALSQRDRLIALRLIGIEIDLQNINWIIRYRTYYQLPYDSLSDLIIPGGFSFKTSSLQDIYRSEHVTDPLLDLLKKNYPKIMVLLSQKSHISASRLTLIEQVLEQIMHDEVKRLMSGYPFTVGILLSYYFLKRLEIKRIRTVLNAGYYELSREQTASLL